MRLHRGVPDEKLTADLLIVDLKDAPQYEALSYVWGNSDERSSIYVNGQCIEVPKGAFEALCGIRQPDCDRLVWVDAVSIDQCSIEERNHQVQLMHQIYGSPTKVLVYLGFATEHSREGMLILQALLQTSGMTSGNLWPHSPPIDVQKYLADIFQRPWFTRMWTVQEAALAGSISLVCGSQQVSWTVDFKTMRAMVFRVKSWAISPYLFPNRDTTSTLDWSPLLMILEAQMRQAAQREGVPVRRSQLDLAHDFKDRLCADPRDKYYAIAGIIESEQTGRSLEFRPDYSLRLEEVRQQFTEAVWRFYAEDEPLEDERKFWACRI